MAILSRRNFLGSLPLLVTATVRPRTAWGDISLSFNVISYGPLGVSVDIPIGSLFSIGKKLFISFFEDGGDVYDCFDSSSIPIPPSPPRFVVVVHPEVALNGRVIRMRYGKAVQRDRLVFSSGRSFLIQNDGRLVFENMPFKGYVLLHYDETLSVWDESGVIVLVVAKKEESTFILRRKSAGGEAAIRAITEKCHAS